MTQPENTLTWWAKLLNKSPLIAIIIALAITNVILWNAKSRSDDALLKCKEDDAATRERILNQSGLNGLKSDNIYQRQTLILEQIRGLDDALHDLKQTKK